MSIVSIVRIDVSEVYKAILRLRRNSHQEIQTLHIFKKAFLPTYRVF